MQDLHVSGTGSSAQGSMLPNTRSFSTGSFSGSMVPSSSSSVVYQQSQPQMQHSQTPMFQSQLSQGTYFPQSSQSGLRFSNNRNKPRGQVFVPFSKPGCCQICGKDNHTARTCYYRSTQTSFPSSSSQGMFPPLVFQPPNMWRPDHTTQFSVPFPYGQTYVPPPSHGFSHSGPQAHFLQSDFSSHGSGIPFSHGYNSGYSGPVYSTPSIPLGFGSPTVQHSSGPSTAAFTATYQRIMLPLQPLLNHGSLCSSLSYKTDYCD
ncbi:hypothetical protein RHGRI_033282 [Rhododendron griersonianum]|uniref:Transcription factor interactor and regulator CCHC(Zn) family n=1 Tax=Rhododendron griersonianum TaxID=479676 RepID=A0AAV6I0C3_9ERIC|nr:hypothetical protein RHGRI_033282 [Rhododendron griersonianum]